MCLEVAFKTGKSLRRSDGLQETVPDRRTGNRKGSGLRCWLNEDVVIPDRYWQTQRILSGTWSSDCCKS